MLIARSDTADGKPVLLLGLSRVNIERLVAGHNIEITPSTHGPAMPDDCIIVIMFGENELALRDDLITHGIIGPDTQQTIDPRLDA